MIFWPHDGDLSAPPELSDLRHRRPTSAKYWESPAGSKPVAIRSFWVKWQRTTGKELPRKLPTGHCPPPGFSGNTLQAARRPAHQSEKKQQDTTQT